MRDSLIPTKPEDFEPAIQQDKKYLKSQLDELILGQHMGLKVIDGKFQVWDKPNSNNVCTCPKIIHTKKRAKKKQLEVIQKATNGYNVYCPIHNNK